MNLRNHKLIYAFLAFLACKQDNNIDENKDVLAGVVTSKMVYFDFIPDLVIDTIPDTSAFGESVNLIDIDIDKNGIPDIRIGTFNKKNSGMENILLSNIIPYNTQSSKTSILASDITYDFNTPQKNSYSCSGQVKKLNSKDVIEKKIELWTTIDSTYKGYPLTNSWFGLAARDAFGVDMLDGDLNNWRNVSNGYMGIRFVQGNDTLYGWVHISVVGYSKIIVHDYAIQKMQVLQ